VEKIGSSKQRTANRNLGEPTKAKSLDMIEAFYCCTPSMIDSLEV